MTEETPALTTNQQNKMTHYTIKLNTYLRGKRRFGPLIRKVKSLTILANSIGEACDLALLNQCLTGQWDVTDVYPIWPQPTTNQPTQCKATK